MVRTLLLLLDVENLEGRPFPAVTPFTPVDPCGIPGHSAFITTSTPVAPATAVVLFST